MHKCINCGNEFDGNFCPACGERANTPVFCPGCGAKVSNGASFCSNCGSRISSSTPPAQADAPQADKLQNELYSLFKIFEPIKELDLAGIAIDKKIAELSGPSSDATKKFYDDFAHYAPFISVDIDEDFIIPESKYNKKEWKAFVKNQKEKLYGKKFYYAHRDVKYSIQGLSMNGAYCGIYNIFKANEEKVLSDLGASFLYYKMDYCYNPLNKPLFYRTHEHNYHGGRSGDSVFEVMSMRKFVFEYLKKKLGDGCDEYLYNVFKNLKGGNKGEWQLYDVPSDYDTVNQAEYKDFITDSDKDKYCDYFYLREGIPTRDECKYINYISAVEAAAKANTKKSMREKIEFDGTLAELRKLRENINSTIDEYMHCVNAYIAENIKIVPFNYARQWRCVTYFLHLLVNKRGKDIYEITNQYEIDMKHRELTSALGDIHTEILSQTNVLGNKLDAVNRSIINQTNAITSAISSQTRALCKQLDSINSSVISTGASIVGSISQLGNSMGQAMSNMKFSVNVG